MPDLTLYLGGTRSGKSMQAERDALATQQHVLYVATSRCPADDAAMCERVRRHRERRPGSWQTLECETRLACGIDAALERLAVTQPLTAVTVLIDCVTMWVTNILCSLPDPKNTAMLEDECEREVQALLTVMERRPCHWIIVSGETGLGGIAASAMARSFADALGLVNQRLAAEAAHSGLWVAGKKLLLSD